MLKTEVAEIMQAPGKVYEIAEKTQYNRNLNGEEAETAEVLDAFAREVGKTGNDRDHEISAFINKTVNDELYNAPDELLDSLFVRGNIGEFDDFVMNRTVKNTLTAHEAAKGGNVLRSYLHLENLVPRTHNLQIESDLSYIDLRRNGFKSVAQLTTFMVESLRNKQFAVIFKAIDDAIAGGDQLIEVQGAAPTMEAMDKLALYLNEYSNGGTPITVSLMKYCAQMRRMTGYAEYLSENMKNDFNRYGLVKSYDGVAITGISSAKKLGDGSMLLPDKKIFGIAGTIGELDMKGETHTYQDNDNNNERVHLMVKDYTFTYAISNIERVAKMTLQ